MPEYRAYFVGQDGHIHNVVVLDCLDDDVAKEQAKQLADGHDIELWQFERKIATFQRKPE
jgi:hypothetical protein